MCLNKRDRLEDCLNHPKPYVYKDFGIWLAWEAGQSTYAEVVSRHSWEEALEVANNFAAKEGV